MKIYLVLATMLMVPLTTFGAPSGNHQAKNPAQQEYMQGMSSMHDDMMKGIMHSDPDVAFAQGMTAHHRGAIEMAKTELKYGKDPEMRRLAQQIIDAQQPEIDHMQAWVNKHPRQEK